MLKLFLSVWELAEARTRADAFKPLKKPAATPQKMNPSESIFIGYFPKRIACPPGQVTPPGIVQICSAGHCGGFAPEGWWSDGQHNEMGVYDSELLAWSIVPEAERSDFELHAYRLFPTRFVLGHPEAIELTPLEPDPLPPDWERLGYDAVSHPDLGRGGQDYAGQFGHSSLSPFCNGQCGRIPVNRCCLLDTAEEGFRRAQEFSTPGGGEPEPYVVVEVWRKRRANG